MSTNRIQRWNSESYDAGRIIPGDLVSLEDSFFDEIDRNEAENMFGLVYSYINQDANPVLLEVLWPDGNFETLYEDEIVLI